jgi:DNA-directed RNA polymerase specialized sigma subunit
MSSPINSRTNAEPLTLDLLRKYVPDVKEGQEAIRLLGDDTEKTLKQKHELLKTKQKGSKAQEVLIYSALPLIKNISSKEFQRRKAWSSRISYDDVLQEAITGFIRGLLSYDETANHTSPTNYLGMWITTSIRRKVESMEHDFAIPYEVVERARRIRAVTGRLTSELTHPPTDEEILEALNDPESYSAKGYKWGATAVPTEELSEAAAARKNSKKFTQAHLNEAKELASRSYGLQSYDTPTIDAEESYEKASTPLTIDENINNGNIEEDDLAKSRLSFFTEAFISMKIGSKQQDIILRYFGMNTYTQPQTQKEIISNTALPPRFVKAVIASFSSYMPRKGGVFHHLILNSDPDLIDGLELSWLLPILGEWPEGIKQPVPAPVILTQTNTKTSQKNL